MEKRIMQKKTWHLGLVVCFFLASFFFSNEVSAQYYPPLVPNAEAENLLVDEVPAMYVIAETLPNGSNAQRLALRKANLFNHTWELLTAGEALESALTQAYGEFARNANNEKLNLDELSSVDIGNKNNPNYGDPAFNALVDFVRQ